MNILICASSSNNIDKKYLTLAEQVSKEINNLNYNLIFGAASTGMMGIMQKNFNKVYSYTVEKYLDDLKNINSEESYILETTMDRTKEMYRKADVILVLPGGSGTFSEIFSILEENRSVKEAKPFLIFNYDNYYDNLIKLIKTSIEENFNSENIKNYFEVYNNLEDIITKIKEL